MKKLRVAVLGTGGIVRQEHLPALRADPRVEVVAAAHVNAASLRELAAEFGIPKTYTDFEALAVDGEIDAVVNALPNYLHASTTIAMLKHGKHVLCEKPMAMNVAEAEAMEAAASATGVKLVIAFPWRSNPDYQWLREKIAAGALGRIYKIRADAVVANWGPDRNNWRSRPEVAGGGVIFDIGSHSLDALSFLFGDTVRPLRVFSQMDSVPPSGKLEELATALIEYDNGMVGVLEAGWNHPLPKSPHGSVEVFGTLGYARTFPTELWTRQDETWHVDSPELPTDWDTIIHRMFVEQARSFVSSVLDNAPSGCDGKQGVANMQLLEAIYRSASQGQAVTVV